MSLLQYAQDVCHEVGIEPPPTIVNNEDDDAKRLLSLFNTEGVRLMRRYPWQALVTEKTFTAVAAADQGLLKDLADDIDRIVPDTLFNRSSGRHQLEGASPSEWQRDQAINGNWLRCNYRLRGRRFLMNPVPGAGDTIAFEYVSKNWAETSSGTAAAAFAADSDVSLLDEDILKLGVKWRLRKVLGGDWKADFAEYQEQLRLRFGNDSPKGTINMDESPETPQVRILK